MMPAQRSTFAATVVRTALGNAAIALAIAAPAHAQPTDRPQLPEWVQLAGEVRDRIEGFTGSGFTPGRDDAYNLTRLKLDVTSRPARLVTFKIQLQDARPFGKDVGPTAAPFKDVLNLHLAYVDIGDPPVGTFGLRIGRQELSFGDERLIGTAGWLNAPRAFDAARATIRRPGVQIDAFGASVVRVADAVFADSSGHGSRLFGLHASTSALVPKSTIQPYVFWRLDRGDVNEATIGARWVGALPARLEYGTEVAVQRGSFGAEAISAWGGHWRIRRTMQTTMSVRAFTEYNYASGDHDASDVRRGTFDPLYQTAHDKYGLADQIGWRNLRHMRSGVEMTPRGKLTVTASYHSWWLADSHDGLYSATGSMVARVKDGAADTHVGQEVDGQVTYLLSPQFRIVGGLAHIFPGRFLETATSGSSFTYPFVGATYTFATSLH